jgi:trans-aconitate 2-methyltransferase
MPTDVSHAGSPQPPDWNPTQYDKFQREREQPFFDLLALVETSRPAAGLRVADLGCGTGRLTRVLHDRLRAGDTIGIDRSPAMLKEPLAQSSAPGLRFEVGTIESFPGERGVFDLVFSNAAFHWVLDHESLLSRLANALAPAGQLAFQLPASHGDPSHIVATELAEVEPYRSALGAWRRPQPVLSPEAYARTLYRLGFRDPKVSLIVYPHILAGPEAVVEWVKGTMLTDFAHRLPADLFDAFLETYRRRLLERLEPSRPFFFPFKRILCWGQLSA